MYAHVKLARVSLKNNNKEISCQIQEQVRLKWCANLHLKILTLVTEISNFVQSLKSSLRHDSESISTTTTEKSDKPLTWIVGVKGDLHLHLAVGSGHEMTVVCSDLMMGNLSNYVGGETSVLKIIIDDSQIFTFEVLRVNRILEDEHIKEERGKTEGLILDKNKIW